MAATVASATIVETAGRETNHSEFTSSSSSSCYGSSSPTLSRSPSPASRCIAFEGIIGVGKSKLTGKLAKWLKELHKSTLVFPEILNVKHLALFYGNPTKYAFSLQMSMAKNRIFQRDLATHDKEHGRVPDVEFSFWDRSIVGDLIFSILNHLKENIDCSEFAAYLNELFDCDDSKSYAHFPQAPFFKTVDLFVYLSDEPENCRKRVLERGRECERDIPLRYYDQLDDIHFNIIIFLVMMYQSAPVLVVRWEQYSEQNMQTLYTDRIQPVLDGLDKRRADPNARLDDRERLPVVGLCTFARSSSNQRVRYVDLPDNALIYRNDDEIRKAYQCTLTDGICLSKPRDVYISEAGLTVSNKSAGYRQDGDVASTIRSHENAYRRVVSWHLTHGQNVFFYR